MSDHARRDRRALMRRSAGGVAAAVVVAGMVATTAIGAPVRRQGPVLGHLAGARGIVIARDAARHTLVISAGRTVRTLRLAGAAAGAGAGKVDGTPLGTDVLARVARLADGTFRVAVLRELGHTSRARVRATVVATSPGHLVLSAGGSVFAVGDSGTGSSSSRLPRALDTMPGPAPGEVVDVDLEISASTIQSSSVKDVGQATLVELEGVLSKISSTTIVVTADAGAITTVTIPASIALPSTFAVGDQVEVVANYSAGTFTLVTIVDDTLAASATGQGVAAPTEDNGGQVEVEGTVVTAATPTGSTTGTDGEPTAGTGTGASTTGGSPSLTSTASTLVVQPGDGGSVTIVVPSTITLPPLATGTRVHAVATMIHGVLTLVSLHAQGPQPGDGQGDARRHDDGPPGVLGGSGRWGTSSASDPTDTSSSSTSRSGTARGTGSTNG